MHFPGAGMSLPSGGVIAAANAGFRLIRYASGYSFFDREPTRGAQIRISEAFHTFRIPMKNQTGNY